MVKGLLLVLIPSVCWGVQGAFQSNYRRGNMICYYNMNENAGTTIVNSSTLAANGTWEGSGNTWVAGKYGSGIHTNGSGGLTIPRSAVFHISNFTILAYIRSRPGAYAGTEGIFLQANGGGNWAFLMQDGKLLGRETNSTAQDLIGSILISSASYTCVAYRRIRAKTRDLFVNGIRDLNWTGTNLAVDDEKVIDDDDPEIACNGGCTNNQFIGSVDEVLMYNVALNDGEISNLCGGGGVGNTVLVDDTVSGQ